jgi:hypothetical protein
MSVTRTMVCKYFMSHLVKFMNLEQRMHKSKPAGLGTDVVLLPIGNRFDIAQQNPIKKR